MNRAHPSVPDFFVEWRSSSVNEAADVYCDSAEKNPSAQTGATFRTPVATLHTDTTHIEVTEIQWLEPTSLVFTPNRPGFCSLISLSSPIEYGYKSECKKSGNLGRVLFMIPGKEVRSNNQPGTVRSITCSFDSQYAESIVGRPLEQFSRSQIINSLDVRSSLISAILLRLMQEALHPGPFSNVMVEAFGRSMLLEYVHCILIDDCNSRAGLTARHFTIIEEYLAGLSGALPSVAQLAAACGFSERYFSKLFREQTRCSVAQYIKTVQITKAKSYLLETDLPLKEISYRLGFSAVANFSAAFRNATGIAPGQYRKNLHS
jgi:AraC family transcriptional regulator